jgi:hypothetical protein
VGKGAAQPVLLPSSILRSSYFEAQGTSIYRTLIREKEILSEEGEVVQKLLMRSMHQRMLLWLLLCHLFQYGFPSMSGLVYPYPLWLVPYWCVSRYRFLENRKEGKKPWQCIF